MRTLIKDLMAGKSAVGIEILLSGNNEYCFNCIILKKQGHKIVTPKKSDALTSWEELKKEIASTKLPLYISVNGKGIIHKKVIISGNESGQEVIHAALPGANASEFTFQVTATGQKEEFISVLRNTVLDEIKDLLIANEMTQIRGFFLGPFPIHNLLGNIDHNNESLTAGNYSFSFRSGFISEIHSVLSQEGIQNIMVGDEQINTNLLIAYGTALTHFTESNTRLSNTSPLNTIMEEYSEKKKFQRNGIIFITSLFALLLLNSIVFSNYWKKNNDTLSQLALNESSLKMYNLLREELADKKNFLEENAFLESSKTSYYADRIAESLPESIQLLSLKINPLKKRTNSEEENLLFENKIIQVTGKCRKSTELNGWLKTLKENPWIRETLLTDYTQDNKNESGSFSLKLTLN